MKGYSQEHEWGIPGLSVYFYCCNKGHDQSNFGRKGFISLRWYDRWGMKWSLTNVKAAAQGRNLDTGTKGDPWGNTAYCLAPMVCLVCFHHNHHFKTQHPAMGWQHSRCSGSSHIDNQENAPTALPTGQSDKGIFLIKFFYSQMLLTCIKF